MADVKVTVAFPLSISHGPNGGTGYFKDSNLSGVAYGSDGQIRNRLKLAAEHQVGEGLRLLKETSGLVIGCTDGTILVVNFKYDGWGYGIYGAGRKSGGRNMGDKSFDKAVESAKQLAAQSYGGVVWENSL